MKRVVEHASFWENILDATGDEVIESVVIGPYGAANNYPEHDDDTDTIPKEKLGKRLSPAEAQPLLSYPHDQGYGSPKCHSVYAWTANRVIFVVQYDGSTRVTWVERHPADVFPSLYGES
jgi:hypothetical protein